MFHFAFAAYYRAGTVKRTFSTMWRWLTSSPLSAALLVGAFGAWTSFLYHYSYPHPFLLADNRHYVFYLWQRFLHKDSVRLALAPVSFYCAFAVLQRLVNEKGLLWTLGYCCALFMTLVPAALLEPRYFIPGVFVAHMNIAQPMSSSVQSLLAFAGVNVATLYVFLCRPFEWHDGSVARFIW
jgi:alpha-1,2-glucosyltransferase